MKNEATEEVKFQELLLKEENEHYFGRCDVCGEDNGCLSVGSTHHFVCHEHKKRWCIGSNLFSCWRVMTEQEFKENADLLETYEEITGDEWFHNKTGRSRLPGCDDFYGDETPSIYSNELPF